ncbi:MAG: SMEK domain-containing protein [Sphaerochaeta sp.]|nr:SMEK domain-containing protein [Sphaerochaeta sp.]
MNRSEYYNYIDEKLNVLAFRIDTRGKINLLDLHIHSETFFADLLNLLFGYNLKNLNAVKQNVEGIDLVDAENRLVVQVSATCTEQKIKSSLAKEMFSQYRGYRFKYISISKNADKLRLVDFSNPHTIVFDPNDDIIDIASILRIILNMSINKQKIMYGFIKDELGNDIDIVKVDSNLATIINILANENLGLEIESPKINAFQISNKIVFNDLVPVQDRIEEYKIYYSKLNEKYEEFDKQGANRSLPVFQVIKTQYTKLLPTGMESYELFYAIIDSVIGIISKSKNYIEIPYEELEMCVHIIVVDAFIRCKIFKNPEGYNHVITR